MIRLCALQVWDCQKGSHRRNLPEAFFENSSGRLVSLLCGALFFLIKYMGDGRQKGTGSRTFKVKKRNSYEFRFWGFNYDYSGIRDSFGSGLISFGSDASTIILRIKYYYRIVATSTHINGFCVSIINRITSHHATAATIQPIY